MRRKEGWQDQYYTMDWQSETASTQEEGGPKEVSTQDEHLEESQTTGGPDAKMDSTREDWQRENVSTQEAEKPKEVSTREEDEEENQTNGGPDAKMASTLEEYWTSSAEPFPYPISSGGNNGTSGKTEDTRTGSLIGPLYIHTPEKIVTNEVQAVTALANEQPVTTSDSSATTFTGEGDIKMLCVIGTRLGYIGNTSGKVECSRRVAKPRRRLKKKNDGHVQTVLTKFITKYPNLVKTRPKANSEEAEVTRITEGVEDNPKKEFLEVFNAITRKRKLSGSQQTVRKTTRKEDYPQK